MIRGVLDRYVCTVVVIVYKLFGMVIDLAVREKHRREAVCVGVSSGPLYVLS